MQTTLCRVGRYITPIISGRPVIPRRSDGRPAHGFISESRAGRSNAWSTAGQPRRDDTRSQPLHGTALGRIRSVGITARGVSCSRRERRSHSDGPRWQIPALQIDPTHGCQVPAGCTSSRGPRSAPGCCPGSNIRYPKALDDPSDTRTAPRSMTARRLGAPVLVAVRRPLAVADNKPVAADSMPADRSVERRRSAERR